MEKGAEYTLVEEANYYAAQYGTAAESFTVNDIDGMKYTSEEEYENNVYTVVNYMVEDDTYIVELSFWTVNTADEYAAVEEIINTLNKN